MKIAVREAVYGEDITVVFVKPSAEFFKRVRLGKLAGCGVAQTQSNRVRLAAAHTIAHPQCVFAERAECLRPIAAAMDVCAVGKMDAVAEPHVRLAKLIAPRAR